MAIARSVGIIGGGIGGLTAANSLKRAGLSVSLYERSPYFIPIAGAGFGMQPNGQISLAFLGFKDQVNKLIQPFLKWQLIDDNGSAISTSNRLAEFETRFGYYVGGALRAELVDMLKEPIEKSNNLHYSHNVTSLQQDPDGVTISFEKQEPVRVDMVVGADGIHSTVVKQIFPQTAPPVHSKENIFYGVIENIDQQTSINPTITVRNTLTQYFGRGEFICYRIGNDGKFIWAATYPAKEPPVQSGDAEWTGVNNQRELTRFLTRFPSSHPVHQCAAATDPKRLLHFGLFYRQHRNDGWHRGRICLLGDSCHATLPYTGQGASLAIEDAIMLALSLEKFQFQMEPAFQDYYQKRFNRTKRVVNMARYMGIFFHSENPIVHAIRERLISRLMSSNAFLKMAEKEFYENCPKPIQEKKTLP